MCGTRSEWVLCWPDITKNVPLDNRTQITQGSSLQVISSKMREEVTQLPARWAVPLLVHSNDDFCHIVIVIIVVSTSATTCIIPHNSI